MKKVLALFLAALLLTGCASSSDGEMNRALALRTKLLKADSCSFLARVSADFGEKLYDFTLDCIADNQGNLRFAVTEPESIAGITGEITGEGGKLSFDSTMLEFGLLADGRLSPIAGPWVLVKALRGGYITGAGQTEGALRLDVSESFEKDALNLDIRLDEKDMPQKADICFRGQRILSIAVENMVIS